MGKKDKLHQVSFLLDKLYDINKQLGGYSFIKRKINYADNKFEVLFVECKDKIMQIKQIQKIQDQGQNKSKPNPKIIVQKYQINNIINDCQILIQSIYNLLNKQAKQKDTCKQLFEFQNKKYKDLKREIENIMQECDLNSTILNLDDIELVQNPVKYSEVDQQSILDINRQTNRINRQEPDKKDLSCFKNIEHNNQIQEQILVSIYEKAKILENKVNEIGEKQKQIGSQVGKSNQIIQKTNTILSNQTQRMKNLVTQLREPSKFCLDITLILFIIGLIGILWQMLK
ncbi:transmembrane protein, putative (macronuclear) [Tetrahymena thermophila SB210]|uniref:Transmembrane protein, putative n=1 Tax=Tetrahymena thermophila (strain SB210) TaxID=312017 RepID=Q22D48_TETTS|nr:transmembrane protein, putative [Tetrahymena thermophila SB210]EAR83205.2 transmembrane protein, putative [Tetrahymena thermophila SB210]|eukprot:XP_001030868.2 transmembrane protein, putative [Tetrahymena thermophila SB210]